MKEKTIKDICTEYGLKQTQLARRFGIPLRSIQNWYNDERVPPDYLVRMIDEILKREKEDKA